MTQFAASISLSALDGTNGFRLEGIDFIDQLGFSVAAAGDVNGDGFGDIIAGAPTADPGGDNAAGESYVVFGKSGGFAATLNLAALDGSNGFRIDGIDGSDHAGNAVSAAGDINGDGIGDLVIGAYGANNYAGETYVIFSTRTGGAASLDAATLDGVNGFRIDGVNAGDKSGYSVSAAGDVNGDGFGDLVIGAYAASIGGVLESGQSYVVFGKASGFGPAIQLAALDGSNGFRMDGSDFLGRLGRSVSAAGDVNGDGFADIIVGAHGNEVGGDPGTGESFVIFGKAAGFTAALDLATLDGINGFRLDGIDFADQSGRDVSAAGDINGDGFGDIIVGAYGANNEVGESYVVFGRASGFAPVLELSALDGLNGFRITGIDAYDSSGFAVAAAGDVNGDGFGDILIGANAADPGTLIDAGESYVVFGKASGFGPSLDLASLDGDTGFRLDGAANDHYSGFAVSGAGDVNGDGFADILIGALGADPGGVTNAGESFVVFGHRAFDAVNRVGTALSQTINGGFGVDTLSGLAGNDKLLGWELSDTLIGGEGDDVLNGGEGADILNGGAGSDTASYERAAVRVKMSLDGSIAAEGEALGDTLISVARLTGSAFSDVLRGNTAANVLRGGGGSDTLQGLDGNDLIEGGRGNDAITGGLGDDRFGFNALSDGGDTIKDFSNVLGNDDSLRFKGAEFGALAAGALDASRFAANIAGTATDTDDRFIYETDAGILRFDSNGTGAGGVTVIATFTGAPTLAAADIVIL